MIHVLPRESFTFKNNNLKVDTQGLIQDITKLIQAASPFIDSVELVNQTKGCTIDILFEHQKMRIVFKNPKDAEFDLNDPYGNGPFAVTPVQMTGR